MSPLPTAPLLPLPIGILRLCGSTHPLSTNMFSVPIFRFLAMVSAPPAVVCLKYVFEQCSRSAEVAACSLSGLFAGRPHNVTFSPEMSCN